MMTRSKWSNVVLHCLFMRRSSALLSGIIKYFIRYGIDYYF